MREWCACGGSIRATTRQVIRWRNEHHCPSQPQPEPDIVQVQGAQIENAARNEWHGLEARIGFTKE